MSFPSFDVEFTKNGTVFQPSQVARVVDALKDPQVSDLFVMSHGWNNDMADARDLYDNFSVKLEEVAGTGLVAGLENRSFAVLRVFWPSKKFTNKDLIPGGGAVSAAAQDAAASANLHEFLESLKVDPTRLGGSDTDPVREATLTQAQALVPQLTGSEAAQREFVFLLRTILDPTQAHADDGSDAFFTVEPLQLFAELQGEVVAPSAVGAGGATSAGGADSTGGAVGIRDVLGNVLGAARRLANFSTYYQMKSRAGTVGSAGLGPLLRQIRSSRPDIRLHLIGHSFGGRLVTAAANALEANTSAITMTLLQAAYSHNGLAQDYDDKGHDGFFRALVTEKRVSGPILITHTKNDKAVGVAYPLASRIAHQKAAAIGDANDPYGGMGRNGAQRTPEVDDSHRTLRDVGEAYSFEPGRIYNLNADRFIRDHSDICNHQAAYALLNSVATV